MVFADLLRAVGDEPVFESGLLLVGDVDIQAVRQQLSRWTASGKLLQLRRGLYALAPPYRRVAPHPFVIANHLVRPSYVSLESALAHHGLIPEYVARVSSVTTSRPVSYRNVYGAFDCRNVRPAIFGGAVLTDLGGGQRAFVATPEKALLDLVHLTPGGGTAAHLRGLRLQNLDRLDLARLRTHARSPKLARAVRVLSRLSAEERQEALL